MTNFRATCCGTARGSLAMTSENRCETRLTILCAHCIDGPCDPGTQLSLCSQRKSLTRTTSDFRKAGPCGAQHRITEHPRRVSRFRLLLSVFRVPGDRPLGRYEVGHLLPLFAEQCCSLRSWRIKGNESFSSLGGKPQTKAQSAQVSVSAISPVRGISVG